ncbi:MAG: DUF4399 domain-containing protein [Methanoregula sp.]|nr:DUF4399 domain-containing protein [Methanoregula sp.]
MKGYLMLVTGAVLAAVLISAGCISGSGNSPGVVITTPQDKATLTGSNVTLNIQISNFVITAESMDMTSMQGIQNEAGTGHIHWFIDVPVPTDPGRKAETADNTWKMHDDTSFTWQNVPPGTHNLSVELVNNDMTPFSPAVYQTITVTVK